MKRVISLMLVCVFLLLTAGLCGCKTGKSERDIYCDGVKSIMEADSISYAMDFSIGDSEYKMRVESVDGGNVKNVNFSSEHGEFEIYVNGNDHYYKTGDIKYKVRDDSDSPLMRELLNMRFFNGEASFFDKDVFSGVEIKALSEDLKTVTFEVGGADLKKSFAPDEDVTFGSGVITVDFNGENAITKVSVLTTVSGEEFYGLPVLGEQDMKVNFSVLKLNENVTVNEPENKNEWSEMPALAVLIPASLVYKSSMGVDINTQINVSMGQIQMSFPMDVTVRSEFVDGKRLTRVVTVSENNGTTQKSDVFTDGNGDYEYYTDPDGNYKMKIEDEESDGFFTDDMMDIESFKNAEIKKSGANTVITVELTDEMFSALTQSGAMSEYMGDFSADGMEFEKSELVIVVTSDGYIASAETKMNAKQSINQPQLGVEYSVLVTVKMDAVFVHPREKIEVEIPSGYLDYPLVEEETGA